MVVAGAQAPGGAPVDFLGESHWLNTLGIPFPFRIVAYAHLAREDTADVLRAQVSAHPCCGCCHVFCRVRDFQLCAQAAIPNVVGIRMIMNHHPTNPALTWPQVEHGDYFTSSELLSQG